MIILQIDVNSLVSGKTESNTPVAAYPNAPDTGRLQSLQTNPNSPSPLRVRVRVKSLRQRGPGYTEPRPWTCLTARHGYFAIVLLQTPRRFPRAYATGTLDCSFVPVCSPSPSHLLMRELIGKHSGPVTRHSGFRRNPEMLSSGYVLCAWRFLDSGFRRNDGIVYQSTHASVKCLRFALCDSD